MGTAVRQSGIPRNEVFLTTKILSAGASPEATYKKCIDSVKKIDGDDGYVDLFLIHTPSGGPAARKEMWQALEKLESEGKARAVGVSNYGVGHIEEMRSYARIWPPHVNQIEVCHRPAWALSVRKVADCVATSYIHGVSNEQSWTTVTSMRLLLKPTALLSEI